ncbi:serine hydrolase domain-containing protein [Cellulomonas chengniuliangii]|uniref:serine hydrolase domain-containing protein n=1 Tax=Cellulomonas chengniuliangii TaxID=2968084 RepID=UPI001D0E7A1A|nr:serine hydrolase domain-containing protein [Cellulomonas chengniuliangii]MCC2317895.1 beta-lactamase family protein [Cellulomonas chengniuliangii]
MSEQPRTKRTAHHRLPTRMSALVMACAFAAGAAVAVPAAAFAGDQDRRHGHGGKPRADVVQQAIDRFVEEDGAPAALAAVTDRKGRERNLVAGVGDLATGAPVPVDGQVRIGSNSKTFVAAVVLQLVGEGAIDLDAPVETYLPGVVRGPVDGNDITVRDLLQHTSGLGNYTDGAPFLGVDADGQPVPTLTALKDWYVEPHELVALGLARPAAPEGEWAYSNTNFVLAGLIVQKATGRPLAEAITERIIEPLGLTDTYVPGRGERPLRGEHPKGYHAEPIGSELFEHTDIDSSTGWAAGDVVSTPSDLNTFFQALLGGAVLQPAELEQMKTTVPMTGAPESMRYGLGLMSTDLSCGGLAWGHGGASPGYQVEGGVSESGDRALTVATTALHFVLGPEAQSSLAQGIPALVDAVLCS